MFKRALFSTTIITGAIVAALNSHAPADIAPQAQAVVQPQPVIIPELRVVDYTFVFTDEEALADRDAAICGADLIHSSC